MDSLQARLVAPGGGQRWYFPPSVSGGAASLINWNVPDASPEPAVVLVTPTVERAGSHGRQRHDGRTLYDVSVDYTVARRPDRGRADSPMRQIEPSTDGEPVWPTVNLMSFEWDAGAGAEGRIRSPVDPGGRGQHR